MSLTPYFVACATGGVKHYHSDILCVPCVYVILRLMALPVAALAPVWTLGDKLAKARRFAGLEQADMAMALNVSRALVSKFERDQSEPRISQLRQWAKVTGVSEEWLLSSGYIPVTGVHMPSEQGELWDPALAVPYNHEPVLASV